MNQQEENKKQRVICLFDIDGTLTQPQKKTQEKMIKALNKIQNKASIGIVSGNPKSKFIQILGQQLFNKADYCFTQNGLVTFKNGSEIHTKSIKQWFGDQKLKTFLTQTSLQKGKIIRITTYPRGTFIQLRTGLLNISPIGRNCSYQQRLEFFDYDNKHKIRQKFIQVLKQEFPQLGVEYSIGGQISFDVYPKGWDKRYCLKFMENEYDKIYFFGDRVKPGGNDYQIYEDERTIGYEVTGPDQTCQILGDLFGEVDHKG